MVDLSFLGSNPYVVMIVFAVVLVVLYRVFKSGIKALFAGIAGFAFPWIAQAIGLDIVPSFELAMDFAVVAVVLFLAYQFFHLIVAAVKVITWPFKLLFKRKRKHEKEPGA